MTTAANHPVDCPVSGRCAVSARWGGQVLTTPTVLDLWPEHLCVQFGVLRGGNHDALCAADGFQFTQCQVAVFERDQAVAQATVDHVIEILESKTIALAALGLMHVEQDEFIGVLIEEKVQGLDQVADRAAGRGAVECLELINVRVSGVEKILRSRARAPLFNCWI